MSIRDRLLRQHGAAPAAPPPPVPWPSAPLVEQYWRCRGCDVTWRGTSGACWCCGEVAP